jgi:pimeloyl-ACP methyl ester carboxylesterase
MRPWVTGLAAAALLGAAALAAWYAHDMRQAYARIGQGSRVLHLQWHGAPGAQPIPVEVAQGGQGLPVLVIHGSGGGWDQGALLARALLDEQRFAWIAPSRFGYLQSGLPPGADFDQQAHAYAALLDALGLQRVAVVALSHGGPSALLFALLHPERVSSLTLVSCGVASSGEAAQQQANQQGDMLVRIYRHDALYWAFTRAFRGPFFQLMGVSPQVLAGFTPEQRALADRVVDEMNPVSPRAAGVALDNRAALPNERIAGIRAPTLVLHARDDSLQLFRNAEFAARHIPGAQLQAWDRGGHLLLAVQLQAIRAQVQQHLMRHAAAGG